MGEDDLLSPEEIEALLNTAGANSLGGEEPSQAAPKAGGSKRPSHFSGSRSTEELLAQAESNLRAAVSPILGGREAEGATPFSLDLLRGAAEEGLGAVGLAALDDVELELRVELGRAELLIEEVLRLREGSVVPLDKLAGDPVDILANGRLIARGEVLVLNDNFCVRVAEILAPGD